MADEIYVRRDGEGNIDGVSDADTDAGYSEKLSEDNPEVAAFLAGPPEPPSLRTIATAIADAIDSGDTTALRIAIDSL